MYAREARSAQQKRMRLKNAKSTKQKRIVLKVYGVRCLRIDSRTYASPKRERNSARKMPMSSSRHAVMPANNQPTNRLPTYHTCKNEHAKMDDAKKQKKACALRNDIDVQRIQM